MVFYTPTDKPLLLLVDDMPANLHVLAAALKQDYRLKTATHGAEALAIMRAEPRPELVLLDVMMSDMNGIEVLRKLREEPETRDVPVIFVTADVSEQSQLNGLELGVDDYLTKPVIASVLRARVKNLLARKRSERELRLAAHVFEHSGEAIIINDRDNRIIEVNPAFTRLTGYTAEEARGRNPRFLSAGRTPPETYRAMWQALQETGFWQGELWDRNKDGAIYPKLVTISTVKNQHDEIEYYIGSFTDISEQKANEEKIRHLAHHDALTGLPNRLFLTIASEQALASAARESRRAALVFLDMDRFKLINDTLGHLVGDEFLIEVGRRLKSCVRESDIVARLGGDEFVVMLTRIATQNDAAHVADKILAALNAPFTIGSHTLHSSPSLGIALYPDDGNDLDTLMKNADTAMYFAKEKGRNNAQFFTAPESVGAETQTSSAPLWQEFSA